MMITAKMSGVSASTPGACSVMCARENSPMGLPISSSKVALQALATLDVPVTKQTWRRGGRDEQGVRHRAARARRPGGAAADPTAPGRSTGVGRGKAPGAGETCVSPEPRMHTRVSHARLREAVSTASRVRPGGACAAPFRPPPSPRPPFFRVCDEPTPVVRSKCQLKETKSLLAH